MFALTAFAITLITMAALTVYGIASFGEGMMFQILLQICSRVNPGVCDGNIATSTLTLSLAVFFTNPMQLWILKEHVDWKLGRNLALFQGIGVVIGVRILFLTQSLLLPHLLGLILFFVMTQKVMSDVCAFARRETDSPILHKYELSSAGEYAAVWTTGLASGLLSGMYGTAGPPLIIFFSTINLEKDIVRGTVCFCDNVINIFRISAFVFNFVLHGSSTSEYGDMSLAELTVMCSVVTCGAAAGLLFGNSLSVHVNQFVFKYLVLSILAMGSVLLSSVGMSSRWVLIIALCLIAVFLVCNSAGYYYVRHHSDSYIQSAEYIYSRDHIEYECLSQNKPDNAKVNEDAEL